MRNVSVREAGERDMDIVRSVALDAHAQYEELLAPEEWRKLERGVSGIAEVAEDGTMFVAGVEGEIAGVVVYIPPGSPKPDIFRVEWAVIRMLSVSPDHRGNGIGRLLSEACIHKAGEDGATTIALHTGEMMSPAQRIYERPGFEVVREIDSRFGFRYWMYEKQLPT